MSVFAGLIIAPKIGHVPSSLSSAYRNKFLLHISSPYTTRVSILSAAIPV